MKNIGLLITKNEAPIIADILTHNASFIKEIFVLDGGDDNTREILSTFPQVVAYYHERDFVDADFKVVDGIRQFIFEKILQYTSPGNWVTLMHGDEMFYHDPNRSISVAEKNGCNLVQWYAPHFFPHKNDLKYWNDLSLKPVHERFTYYAHYKDSCWIENRQFKITEGMFYDAHLHSGVLPNSPNKYLPLPVHPIYRHFKVWDLNLDNYSFEHSNKYRKKVARPTGKWGCVHYSPRKWKDFFIRKYPKYSCTSHFDGSFGKLAANYEAYISSVVTELPEL